MTHDTTDTDKSDQYIDKNDFHTLLAESVRQAVDQERQQRHDRICKLFNLTVSALTPVMIGVATLMFNSQQADDTVAIARSNIESAEKIARSNIESAEKIAQASRNQAEAIAASDLSLKKLGHLNEIFKQIILNKDSDSNTNALKMQISSLEAYGDSALIYLINIRNHYENKQITELVSIADSTINSILSSGQINLSDHRFTGEKEDALNLRKRKFVRYNLSNSDFIYVNLFMADFSTSTLKYVLFEHSDLYKATFAGANLSNSKFRNCDLRKTNFKKANLYDVVFSKCRVGGAYFSLGSLVKVDIPPFSELIGEAMDSYGTTGKDKYLNLLLPHIEQIEKMGASDTDINKVVETLKMESYQALVNKLKIRKKDAVQYSKTQNTPTRESTSLVVESL